MPSPPDDADSGVGALSERELYELVHRATRDAVLDAVGTVLLAVLGLVLLGAGLSAVVGALDVAGLVAGVVATAGGLALLAWALDVVPSLR